MGLHNTATRWGWPAKLLHWVLALLIFGLLGLGTYMTSLELGLERLKLTQIHKSFGFVVFWLAVIRVVWRKFGGPAPEHLETSKPWERFVSSATHVGMYILMFMIPLTGWLMSSASPFNDADSYIYIPNMVFGLFEMPDPISPGDAKLSKMLGVVHRYAGYALAALLFVHLAAAFKHHFILRDPILTRMLPFGRDR